MSRGLSLLLFPHRSAERLLLPMKPFRIVVLLVAVLALAFAWRAVSRRPVAAPAPALAAASATAPATPAPAPIPAPAAVANPVASAASLPAIFGARGAVTLDEVPAGRFREQLQQLTPAARARALAALERLRIPHNDVAALAADIDGHLYYECAREPVSGEPLAAALSAAMPVESAAPVAITAPPVRHSRPGATRVLYLDFNGHNVSDTAWNFANTTAGRPAVETYACRPYDTDGNEATFSDAEQAQMVEIWQRVAEDYSAFDVDVTTEEPAVFTAQTLRALITRTIDANGVANPSSATSSGVAYIDVYGRYNLASYSPAFVYYDVLSSPAAVAEVVAHELGHNLALSHDGTTTKAYYSGHGTGDLSWGPIMGAPFSRRITQWSKGEYYDANNPQDDLALIAARLTLRTDLAGSSLATATPASNTGNDVSVTDVLRAAGESHYHRVVTAAGRIGFTATPANYGNTDLRLELLDASGAAIALDDPADRTIGGVFTANPVPAGIYNLKVTASGTGTPLVNPPSGYTSYGSIGQYKITGTVVAGPPVIVSGNAASVGVGHGFLYQIVAAGDANGFGASGLPPGVSIDSATGILSGRPTATGVYAVTLSATNSVGTGTTLLTLTVNAAAPAVTATSPSYTVLTPGGSTTLSANGFSVNGAIAYQWVRNGRAIAGATSSSYVATAGPNGGYDAYWLEATNTIGTTRGAPFFVRAAPAVTRVHAWNATSSGTPPTIPAGLGRVVDVAAGGALSLAARADGSVVTWGTSSTVGSLGTNVVAVAAGNGYAAALRADGTVAVVGAGSSAPLVLAVPAGLRDVVAIAAGSFHLLALKTDGTVVTWGDDNYGLLNVPANLTNVVAVAAGGYCSVALKADGTVVTWGYNATTMPPALAGVIAVATSDSRSVVLKSGGTTVAWGNSASAAPRLLPEGSRLVAGDRLYAVLPDGTLVAWAASLSAGTMPANLAGVVTISGGGSTVLAIVDGAGDAVPSVTASPVSVLRAVGDSCTFTVTANGPGVLAYQWRNDGAPIPAATTASLVLPALQLADAGLYDVVVSNHAGATTSAAATLSVEQPPSITSAPSALLSIETGAPLTLSVTTTSAHGPLSYQWKKGTTPIPGATSPTLAIPAFAPADAGVYVLEITDAHGLRTRHFSFVRPTVARTQIVVWGQPGNGPAASLPLLSDAVQFHANYGIGIAVRADGSAKTWSYLAGKIDPLLASRHDIVDAAVGSGPLYTLHTDGRVRTWDSNGFIETAPVRDVVALAGDNGTVAALLADGTVRIVSSSGSVSVPTGLADVVAVAAGSNHVLALRRDGTVVAFGANYSGQCDVPAGLTGVTAIAAATDHSVALKSDGKVLAWGRSSSYTPAAVPTDLGPVTTIAAGTSYTLARCADGSLRLWGNTSAAFMTVPAPSDGIWTIGDTYGNPFFIRAAAADSAPTIAVPPVAIVTGSGLPQRFTVRASGAGPFRYQWRKNGVAITGATQSFFDLIDPQPADLASYDVVVSNHVGSVTSAAATLTLVTPPTITAPPPRRFLAVAGQTVRLSVTASSTYGGTLSYQWKKNNRPIAGATATVFELPAFARTDAGAYTVEVTDTRGAVARATTFVVPDFDRTQIRVWNVGTMAVPELSEIQSLWPNLIALSRAGELAAWDYYGAQPVAVLPRDRQPYVAVAASYSEDGFALSADGTVSGWGSSTGSVSRNVPANLRGVIALSRTANDGLALCSDGRIYRWGYQRGLSALAADTGPVSALVAGDGFLLVLRTDGTVLTLPIDDSVNVPAVPANLSGVIAIAAGNAHCLALKSDGTIVAWGANSYRQCDVPAGLSDVVAIGGNYDRSYALTADGTLRIWGGGSSYVAVVPAEYGRIVDFVGYSSGAWILRDANADAAPAISVQPAGGLRAAGSLHTFRVTATGSGTLSYQWRRDGVAIAGATQSTLTLNAVQLADAGRYDVVVSNYVGRATSASATLDVASPPVLNAVAGSRRVVAAGSAVALTFTVESVAGPVTLQWKKNNRPLPGATTATLSLPSFTPDDAGAYTLDATDSRGIVSRSTIFVLPAAATVVRAWGANTASQTTLPAVDLSGALAVAANGDASYALCADGTVAAWGQMSGYDNPRVRVPAGLANVVGIAAGAGSALALRDDGTVTAWSATSTLSVPPATRGIIAIAANATLNAALGADGSIVYWITNNSAAATVLPPAASPYVAIAVGEAHVLALRADGTVAGFVSGSSASAAATVPATLANVVAVAAGGRQSIALRADGSVVTWGENAGAQAIGAGDGLAVTAGSSIAGAVMTDRSVVVWPSSSAVAKAVPADLADVQQIALGTSHGVALVTAVGAAPTITRGPLSLTRAAGDVAVFDVVLTGSGLRYQWRKNGTPIAGATASSLVLSPLTEVDAAAYDVVVLNGTRVATSTTATLTIAAGPQVTSAPPARVAVTPGTRVTLEAAATSAHGPITYRWKKDNRPLPDATAPALALGEFTPAQAGAYTLEITDARGVTTRVTSFVLPVRARTQLRLFGDQGYVSLNEPVPAALGDNLVSAAMNDSRIVVLRADGTVAQWEPSNSAQVLTVSGLTNVVAVAVNGGSNFALRADGTVWGWGYRFASVTQVTGLSEIIALVPTGGAMLALRSNGTLVEWGSSGDYAAYVPTTVTSAFAATGARLWDVVTGSASGDSAYTALAVRLDGSVVGWTPSSGSSSIVPGAAAVRNAVRVANAGYTGLAVRADGLIQSWGDQAANFNQALAGGVAIDAKISTNLALALRTDGSVAAWQGGANVTAGVPAGPFGAFGIAIGSNRALVLRDTTGDTAPTVLVPPAGQMLLLGSNATFTVTAGGPAPYTYQWRKDGVSIAGATQATLVVPAVTQVDVGSYDVVVSNHVGSVTSAAAMLHVGSVEIFATQPAARQIVATGAPVTLAFTLRDPQPGDVARWQFNNRPIAGATTLSYAIPAVTAETAGAYTLIVTRADNTVVWRTTFVQRRLGATRVAAWGKDDYGQARPPVAVGNALALAAGDSHGLALREDGTVIAWGYNGSGQCTVPANLRDVVAIAAGSSHSLALRADGTVVQWGSATAVPANLQDVISLSADGSRSAALKSDGTVVVWGGNGSTDVVPPTDLTAIAVGADHVVGIKQDGAVVAWPLASIYSGQTTVPAGLGRAQAIGASSAQSGALGVDGRLYVWGSGSGAVALGATTFTAFDCGPNFGVALRSGGGVLVWGDNTYNQRTVPASLGNPLALAAGSGFVLALCNAEGDSAPTITEQPADITTSAGNRVTLRVVATGPGTLAYQWRLAGNPLAGATQSTLTLSEIGSSHAGSYDVVVTNHVGTVTSRAATLALMLPPEFSTRPPARIVATLGQSLSLEANAVTAFGPVTYRWKKNNRPIPDANTATLALPSFSAEDAGAYTLEATDARGLVARATSFVLPDYGRTELVHFGSTSSVSTIPAEVSDAISVVTGGSYAAALRRDGTVTVWGSGAVATGKPAGLTNVVALAAASESILALRADGTVVGWGSSYYGILNPPAAVRDVIALAHGGNVALAVRSDGTVVGWGSNYSSSATLLPVPTWPDDIASVATNGSAALAVTVNGAVVGWGERGYGQTRLPSELGAVIAAAVGYYHSLVLQANGTLVAWGSSSGGVTSVPVGNFRKIATSDYRAAAIRNDGTLAVWGNNYGYGENTPPADTGNFIDIALSGSGTLALRRAIGDALPVIVTSPRTTVAARGGEVSLSVVATSARTLSYQWRRNGVELAGANAATLTLNDLTDAAAGDYDVVVRNSAGAVTSAVATLSIETAPVITTAPDARQLVAIGGSRTLAVTCTSEHSPLAYRWKKNNRVLAGQTTATLTLANFTAADAGAYTLEVTDALGLLTRATTFVLPDYGRTQVRVWGYDSEILRQAPLTLTDALSFSLTSRNVAALRADGTITIWGAVYSIASPPAGLNDAVAFAMRDSDALALRKNGTVVAWGNYGGPPAGLRDVIAIAVGDNARLALRSDGTVVSWSYYSSPQATPPEGLNDVSAIAAGSNGYLALKVDGTVVAWGNASAAMPTGLTGVVAIDAYGSVFSALKSDGTLVRWGGLAFASNLPALRAVSLGDSAYAIGQALDGSLVGFGTPGNNYGQTQIPANLGSVRAFAAGPYHVVALRDASADAAPMLTAEPASVTVNPGVRHSFVVAASGAAPLSYQWFRNGAAIAGATSTVLTLPDVGASDVGDYTVRITNHVGTRVSAPASLRLLAAPQFTARPARRIAAVVGAPISLSATVVGASPESGALRYQWKKDNRAIAGATGPQFNLPAFALADAGAYTLEVTDALGAVARHTTFVLPTGLVTQVRSWGSTAFNSPVTLNDAWKAFAVGSSGALALRSNGQVAYWGTGSTPFPVGLGHVVDLAVGFNGAGIALRDDQTLVSPAAPPPANATEVVAVAAGTYHFLALRADGRVVGWAINNNDSYGAAIVPTGLQDVVAITAYGSTSAALTASGNVVVWGYRSAVAVPPSFNGCADFALGNSHALARRTDGTVVGWALDYSYSGEATPPSDLGAVSRVFAGSAVSFAVKPDGSVRAWGTTSYALVPVPTDLANVLHLSVGSSSALAVRLAAADAAPQIVTSPQAQNLSVGASLVLSVTVSGTGPFSYQWRRDGIALDGATASAFAISSLTPGDAGSYDVVVTNHRGSVTSAAARITLASPPTIVTPVARRTVLTRGQTVTLSVSATTDDGPLSYRWKKNNRLISGATGATYSIPSATVGDSGAYTVEALDAAGRVRRSTGFVAVAPAATQLVAFGYSNPRNTDTTFKQLTGPLLAAVDGSAHSVALKADGTVVAWGYDSYGLTSVPAGLADVVAIAAAGDYALALKSDGKVVYWGYPYGGPKDIPAGLADVIAISAAPGYALALKSDGTVTMWGTTSTSFVVPAGLAEVVSIFAAPEYALATKSDGSVVAWGSASSTQVSAASSQSGLRKAIGSSSAAVGLKQEGTVVGWGSNSYSQLSIPSDLTNVADLATGNYHVVALKSDGSLVAWGYNYNGGETSVPTGLNNAYAISAYGSRTLVLRDASGDTAPTITASPQSVDVTEGATASFTVAASGVGTLRYQWRRNGVPITGANAATLTLSPATPELAGTYDVVVNNHVGATSSSTATLTVRPLPRVASVGTRRIIASVGDSAQLTVSATGTGALSYQWRRNGVAIAGATGATLALPTLTRADAGWYVCAVTDANGTRLAAPQWIFVVPRRTQVVGWGANSSRQADAPATLNDAIALAAGEAGSFALRRDGSVLAWGNTGALPSTTATLAGVVGVSMGSSQSLTLHDDGTVRVWGSYSTPAFPSGEPFVAVASSSGLNVALRADGTAVTWNYYSTAVSTPSEAVGLAAVAAGSSFVVGLKSDGAVVQWGSPPAAAPAGLAGVRAIATGSSHALALRSDGTVVAWGSNNNGACDVPADLSGVVAISATRSTSFAVKADGTVVAWGDNSNQERVPPVGLRAVHAMASASNANHALVLRDLADDTAPMVTPLPATFITAAGEAVTLTVTLSGAGPFSYQWKKDGVAIPGATTGTLLLDPVTDAHAGDYTVTVSNHIGATQSSAATVIVETGPSFTSRAAARIIGPAGAPLTLSGAASGAFAPITYQWNRDNRPIPGATSGTLTIENFTNAQAGAYTLVATDAHGHRAFATTFVLPNYGPTQLRSFNTAAPTDLGPVVDFASGSYGGVAVRRDGSLAAWGSSVNTPPSDITDAVRVSHAGGVALALRANGSVISWGATGDVTSMFARAVNVVAIATSSTHALALRADGSVVAWGQNNAGQCNVPVGLTGVVAIAATSNVSGAVKADGSVVLWGGSSESVKSLPANLTGVVRLVFGDYHALALRTDGSVVVWGQSAAELAGPAGLAGVTEIAAGYYSCYAIDGAGNLRAWGNTVSLSDVTGPAFRIAAGSYGFAVLRDSSSDAAPTITAQPADVNPGSNYSATFSVAVSGSGPFSYQWRRDGAPIAGANYSSLNLYSPFDTQIGRYDVVVTNHVGSVTSTAARLSVGAVTTGPVIEAPSAGLRQFASPGQGFTLTLAVSGNGPLSYQWLRANRPLVGATSATLTLPSFTAADAGPYTLVVTDAANVTVRRTVFVLPRFAATRIVGWGRNDLGQTSAPATVTNAVALAAGERHSLALRNDGSVTGWGSNLQGQLTLPSGLTSAVALAAGPMHSFALNADGTVLGWGAAAGGVVSGASGYRNLIAIAAGANMAAGLRDDGSVVGWGAYYSYSTVPTLTDAVAVAAGSDHAVALRLDGTVAAWGDNTLGQTSVPSGLSGVTAIAAGYRHTLALKSDGTVVAWGQNHLGQATPPALSNIVAVYAGGDWSAARSATGQWTVWGDTANATVGAASDVGPLLSTTSSAYHTLALVDTTALHLPLITEHPQGEVASAGATIRLRVVATGTGTLRYQWYCDAVALSDGARLSGSQTAALELTGFSPADVGNYSVVVSDAEGSVGSVRAPLSFALSAQTISFPALLDRVYASSAITLTASASSGLPVSFAVVSGPAIVEGNQLTLTGSGTVVIRATQGGDATYSPASAVERSFVVTRASATVTLSNLVRAYSGAAQTVVATTNPQNLSLRIRYDGRVEAPSAAGIYSVFASIDDPRYVGSAAGTLEITGSAQTITFAPIGSRALSGGDVSLVASASSGLPVAFSLVSGPARLAGNQVVLTGPGTVTVRASQAGDANFFAAPDVERSFVVVTGFAGWQAIHFSSEELALPVISGPNADPDADGLGNLMEYALGSDPRASSSAPAPAVGTTATEWTLTYTRPSDRLDLSYTVECSPNLTTWSSTGVTHTLVSSSDGLETWQASYPIAGNAPCFFRLAVTR